MATVELRLSRRPPTGRGWLLGTAYLLVFLLLDWVSYIRPFQGFNITPWNPQPALAIALLLLNRRWLWLVWLSLVVAEVAVRGLPVDWFVTLAATAALALCYGAIARAAFVRLGPTLQLAARQDLLWFAVIAIGGALSTSSVYLGIHAAAEVVPRSSLMDAIARYWIGDAVGLAVMLPMLLVLMDTRRRATLVDTLRRRDWCWIAATIAALLVLVFGRADSDHFKFFYLLFLPAVWASTRFGLAGAVLSAAMTQAGLIIAVQSIQNTDLSVFELQLLMTAITMTGLILGVTVDERERAAAELKGSLRLAAAGQMAAALAHELSQPLTALNSYAEASRLIVSSPDMPERERLSRLADVSVRMADDAVRASDVVKRLRDFFRTGSTQLQAMQPDPLLAGAIAATRRRADALGVRIDAKIADRLPVLLIDPVQIGVVLRNLLTNALDAASAASGPRQITVRASVRKGMLLVEVLDSGGGVQESRVHALFEPGPSDKPGGMGVGLSICRAIVEAHGGQLWAEPGPGGHFCLALPLERPHGAGEPHAP